MQNLAFILALSLLPPLALAHQDNRTLQADQAGESQNARVRSLCENGAAEGTYVAELANVGTVRVNIVCFTPERIGANIRSIDSDAIGFTLVHTAIDGDEISFLAYSPEAADAHGVPAHGLTRLRLHLPSLKDGTLRGNYRGLRTVTPLPLNAEREARFPHLLGANAGAPASGEFRVTHRGLNFTFALETVGGIQRGNLVIDGGSGYFLAQGLETATAGGSFYLSSGVIDDELGRANLIHLRGRAVSENELEVYFLDTKRGLIGPMRAIHL